MEIALESTYYSVSVPKLISGNRYIIGARLCIAICEKIQQDKKNLWNVKINAKEENLLLNSYYHL